MLEAVQQGQPRWLVMKFGGTSVVDRRCWQVIHDQIAARVAEGYHVLVVVSAIRGVTDEIQQFLASPMHASCLVDGIRSRYLELYAALELDPCEQFETHLAELVRLAHLPAAELASPAQQARLLPMGEYLTSCVGAAYLRQHGLDCQWQDARSLLTSRATNTTNRASYLSASCNPEPDTGLAARLAAEGNVQVTQGFVASRDDGEPVVLGRGGSDTSGSYCAALLSAERLEIWTDVPGMFSANPRLIPGARLLKHAAYREVQELASMGARVLHPRSIDPVREASIPLHVRWTRRPDAEGTIISAQARDLSAQVKGIAHTSGITLIVMEGFSMWQQVGFLADAFAMFKKHRFSVDLVSTSEANVTVSLDLKAHLLDTDALAGLVEELGTICRVQVIHDCASVSLVGMGIRTILHRLGPALEVFEHRHIYLVSQAANDLNLTFVVDERHAEKLVLQLHQQLIPGGVGGDSVFGETWEQLHRDEVRSEQPDPWWRQRQQTLLELMEDREAAYVYSRGEVSAAAERLASMDRVGRVLYSMKANPHPELLRAVAERGMGIECVSLAEVDRALQSAPGLSPERILFTPNFASRREYREALERGIPLTIDNLFVLEHWGEELAGRELFLRLDPGSGLGHHKLVRTAGVHSKFGIPSSDHDAVLQRVRELEINVIGLHAHVGSGVMHADAWHRTLAVLLEWMPAFPELRYVDLGGGLGVPDKFDELPLDLHHLNQGIGQLLDALEVKPEIWLEPGRYLVAQAGVLLARVTQTKGKGDVRYVGLGTGMNSLLRPALYGAYHEIYNLTRLHETPRHVCNVVGPICETGDILGLDRLLPECHEGDVLLIANTGAYGAAMASRYNLREPAEEIVID